MAGTVTADRLEADSASQLVIENGIALTPPRIADVNNVEIGRFCRAWVNFNGTGSPAVRSSFNVSSITDNGVGRYTITFINAMPTTTFACIGTCGSVSGRGQAAFMANEHGGTFTASTPLTVPIYTYHDEGGAQDSQYVSAMILA